MISSPRILVERFYNEVWNASDENVAREILSSELVFHGSLGTTCLGVENFIAYMRSIHTGLANYRCTIDDMIVSENRAAARMTFGGVHRNIFLGVPATGRTITWAGCAFFTTADDRIRDVWVLGDVDRVKQQLGLSPL